MPRKASGEPKVKRVECPQPNGDIYIYEVTTLYNPQKRYNEHVSSRLLGKNLRMVQALCPQGRVNLQKRPVLLPCARPSVPWTSLSGSAGSQE